MPETNSRNEDIYALDTKPIVANASDFMIWQHVLPNGNSAYTPTIPKFIRYINYAPLDAEIGNEWV